MVDTQTERRAVEQNGLYQTDDLSEEPQDQAIRDRSPHEGSSDSDNAERTARNKLKKASIAALSEHSQPISVAHGTHPPRESVTAESLQAEVQPSNRGRLPKKRSFENLQTDDSPVTTENGSADQPHPKTGHHKRMRSRDISSGVYIPSGTKFENGAGDPLEEESDDEAQESPGGPGVLVDATSLDAATPQPLQISDPVDAAKPEKKRSRDQLDADETSKLAGSEDSEQFKASLEDDELAPTISRNAMGEPEKKRHAAGKTDTDAISSSPSTTTAIPATSAFANTSTASPFGNFKSSPKDPQNAEAQSTSTSAFASSGLSAFASSEKSPFGVFGSSGSTSSGGFGSGTAPTGFSSATATTAKGGFGNRGATSPFAANSTTGFGSLGGGFGSSITGGFGGGRFGGGIKPLGGGLSSFASASGPGGFGGGAGAKQKAFGAPDEEDEDGSDGGDSNDDDADERPRDRRFVEQDRTCFSLVMFTPPPFALQPEVDMDTDYWLLYR